MVRSIIKPLDVNYNEYRKIDQEDIDYTTFVYETNLFDKDIEIVLGNEKHNYSKHDILHFSIYLIIDESPVSRIGIFEIDNNKYLNSIDEDGSIDLEKGELIFFIEKEELSKLINVQSSDDKNEDTKKESDNEDYVMTNDDYEDLTDNNSNDKDLMRVKIEPNNKRESSKISKNDNDLFSYDEKQEVLPLLDEENEKESDKYKSEYKEGIKTTWIEKFTSNNNFGIIDNEGGGDCMFSTLRDAFRFVGKRTTVEKLRDALSGEANEEIYNNYRMLYVGFLNEYKDGEKQIKDMQQRIKNLKKMIDNTSKKEENDRLLNQLKEQMTYYDTKKAEHSDTKDLLKEFEFMKEVDSFEKFRELITTSKFWGDTWSISTMEKLLNVKTIILSEEAFNAGDLDSVMQCGQLNDNDIENIETFKPEYYIMMSYTGNHYTLVSYKNKGIFKFREIPFDIKSLIINKCLEKNSGPYYLIPDFKKYKENIGLERDIGEPSEEDIINDLYDKDITFMFHSKSNKKPKAGKGSGENIPIDRIIEFNKLNKLTDWRRKLNDDWIAPFTIDGKRWGSVTHYYLGSQYKKGFPDFSNEFSMDSESDISKDVEVANAAVETGKYKKKILRESNITIDPDFFEVGLEPRYKLERERALEAKYTQNKDLKQILMETKSARLISFRRGKEPLVDEQLMKLRKNLS
jgi:hypothetical protein